MSGKVIGFLAVMTVALAGCSNRDVYEATKSLRVDECEKVEMRERQACLEHAGMPYSEYEQARQDVTEADDRSSETARQLAQ